VAALAISAVDIALWDLKSRLLELPLSSLLGRFREAAPVYGSGGFCSYADDRLAEQMRGYVDQGIRRVKMKVGREPEADPHRCAIVRDAVGDDVELYVDANDDLEGLRYVRDRAPSGQVVAAGEYAWDLPAVARMIPAVHVQQVDVTRCGGITNFLRAGALCQAHQVPLSAHCAPNLSAHVCCAVQTLAHIEYFHDHVRIENLLFEGTLTPERGALRPEIGRPGHGLQVREDALDRLAA
jgi:L-alanine-DL-glutamate epimerase-like enolase superfamily enzyme